jgi:hypothetical protein
MSVFGGDLWSGGLPASWSHHHWPGYVVVHLTTSAERKLQAHHVDIGGCRMCTIPVTRAAAVEHLCCSSSMHGQVPAQCNGSWYLCPVPAICFPFLERLTQHMLVIAAVNA